MLGFRSGKLWKKIISVAYLAFWGIMFLLVMFDGKYKGITTYDFIIGKIEDTVLMAIFITPYIFLSKTKMRKKLPLFKAGSKVKSVLGLVIVSIMLFVVFGLVNTLHSEEYAEDMKNHSYVIVTQTAATCNDAGVIDYECDYCGTNKSEEIAALGHDMQEVSRKGANCEDGGAVTEKCTRCDYVNEIALDVLGHDMQEVSRKDATCEEAGAVAEKCTRCDHTSETVLEALGHDLQETSGKGASCEENGLIVNKCTRCSYTSKITVDALGHKMKKLRSEATCEDDGLITEKCDTCGKVIETILPATGHDMEEVSRKEPTEESEGEIVEKCKVCGKEAVETIKKLGLTEEEYKQQCKKVSYEAVARNPRDYVGMKVVFKGKVVEVQENGNKNIIRLNVTRGSYGIWEDTIYVEYTKNENESRILEDDIITVYGEMNGIKTYTAIFGNQVSIPHLNAKYIEIN